jgi:phage terminase large subunit-like protein
LTSYSREGLQRAQFVRVFLRNHVKHTKDRWAGQPFVLEDWQWRHMIKPVYGTLRRDGKRRYRRALWGLPRWNGKDELCGGLNLFHLTMEPVYGGEQYAVATTLPQAGILRDTVKHMANADGFLKAVLDIHKREIECPETGAVFRTMPHDADTAQGFHGNFVVLDEAHVYRDRKMLMAMQSGMIGREEPLLIIITTAGEERKGFWWEILKEWRADPEAYVYWAGATDKDDPGDPQVWLRANPASWITEEKLRDAYNSMPPSDFERYHLNRAPKTGQNHFFDANRWDACSALPKIDAKKPCVLSVDASLRRDHTVVILDQLGGDSFHNVMCFPFTAEDDGSIMSAIDQDEVGELIRELCNSYRVSRAPCDQAYFVRTMTGLIAEGLPIEAFSQANQPMARACQRLFDVVAEGRLRHGGDPRLREYVLNTVVKETMYGPRFNKPDPESKIDGAVALAMAVDIAEVEREEGDVSVAIG